MFIRLCLCMIMLTSLQTPLHASPDLARLWGQSAETLYQHTMDLHEGLDRGQPVAVSDRYGLDLFRFGRTAALLAQWIDTTHGPADLGCIFRGMSEDATAQLSVLETAPSPGAQRAALDRLTTLFADAQMIAQAAQKRAPAPSISAAPQTATCPADGGALLDILR